MLGSTTHTYPVSHVVEKPRPKDLVCQNVVNASRWPRSGRYGTALLSPGHWAPGEGQGSAWHRSCPLALGVRSATKWAGWHDPCGAWQFSAIAGPPRWGACPSVAHPRRREGLAASICGPGAPGLTLGCLCAPCARQDSPGPRGIAVKGGGTPPAVRHGPGREKMGRH